MAAFDRNAWPRSIGLPGRNRRNPHTAPALGLDGVEFGDTFERLAGNRRRTADSKLVEVSADMCPTEGELHCPSFGERPVTGIAVNLQDAGEAGQMNDRSLRLAVGA